MHIDDPAMLLTFDGKLAYVGRCRGTTEHYYVEHGGFKGGVLNVHDTLGEALLAAAKEIGAVP